MDGIAGIIDLQGKSLKTSRLREMSAPVLDNEGLRRKIQASIWQDGTHGNFLPLSEDHLVVVSAARFDNKKALFSSLKITHGDGLVISDNHLILKAYQKWGSDCVKHFSGDWSFAVWHQERQTLFLARDHFGNTGLYFYIKNEVLIFSSFLKTFLDIPGFSSPPNEEYIASLLTVFPPDGKCTIYKDIQRVPPAHYLIARGNDVHLSRYYFLENTPALSFSRDEDYVDAFEEIFGQAVTDRIKGCDTTVGITLSGGLDSSAVAVTAADSMKKEHKTLQAFTHVPFYDTTGALDKDTRFGDESFYVKKITAKNGNIEVDWVFSKNVGPVKGLNRLLDRVPEPIFSPVNSFWIIRLLEKAKKKGVCTLLTGQMGNATISWSGNGYLAALAKTGRWFALFNELRSISIAQSSPMWHLFVSSVCLPFAPDFLYQLYSKYRRSQRSVEDYSAIHPGFIKKIRLYDMMHHRGHDPFFQPMADSRKMRYKIILPGTSPIGCFWHELGHSMGIRIWDPTLDKRVMEFCIAIPDDQYLKGGTDRRLVRRAFEGRLPCEVLWNHRKGMQAADIVYRLRHHHNEVTEYLNKIEQLDMARKYLDINKMRRVFQSISGPITPGLTFSCGAILMRGLMVGICLQRYFS